MREGLYTELNGKKKVFEFQNWDYLRLCFEPNLHPFLPTQEEEVVSFYLKAFPQKLCCAVLRSARAPRSSLFEWTRPDVTCSPTPQRLWRDLAPVESFSVTALMDARLLVVGKKNKKHFQVKQVSRCNSASMAPFTLFSGQYRKSRFHLIVKYFVRSGSE